jgi:hypothetical protein
MMSSFLRCGRNAFAVVDEWFVKRFTESQGFSASGVDWRSHVHGALDARENDGRGLGLVISVTAEVFPSVL